MRLYQTPSFAREATAHGLIDADLRAAAREIASGLIDAHLGGELIKKRVATGTKGKRGGLRTVIAWRQGYRCFFLHVFGKGEKSTLTDTEQKALKVFGKGLMAMSDATLAKAVSNGRLREVCDVPDS
ncbi:MAG: type II toxin-antitoxin system RelE/ParE family toxin [Verrucomicrobiota bacterium]